MTLALGACAPDNPGDPQGDDGEPDGVESVARFEPLTPPACTRVAMTAPAPESEIGTGVLTQLTAMATCDQGATPEYQYWAKLATASNWTILGGFVSGSFTWNPPAVGTWQVSAVARAVGATGYQARSAGIRLNIFAQNRAPIAAPDTITITRNVTGSVNVLANDSDPDGDMLQFVGIASQPSHGSLGGSGSMVTYTPAQDYLGPDSFTYTVTDGQLASTGTVSVMVNDQLPVAVTDTLVTNVNAPMSVDVLANDTDADNDTLMVTSVTQPSHGSAMIVSGQVQYTPANGYSGADSFTYVVDDGHGGTATGTVNVVVRASTPGCVISITGPTTGVFNQVIHLTATAVCNTGPAQVQWYRRNNSGFVVVQAFGAPTLDFTADATGPIQFRALARTMGAAQAQATSNTVSVNVADSAPACTAVTLTAPTASQMLQAGMAQTVSASATCPADVSAEFLFYVRPAGDGNWTLVSSSYVSQSDSWTPPSGGMWNVRAVARAVGSHVAYQVSSMSVTVNVANMPQ